MNSIHVGRSSILWLRMPVQFSQNNRSNQMDCFLEITSWNSSNSYINLQYNFKFLMLEEIAGIFSENQISVLLEFCSPFIFAEILKIITTNEKVLIGQRQSFLFQTFWKIKNVILKIQPIHHTTSNKGMNRNKLQAFVGTGGFRSSCRLVFPACN